MIPVDHPLVSHAELCEQFELASGIQIRGCIMISIEATREMYYDVGLPGLWAGRSVFGVAEHVRQRLQQAASNEG